MQDKRGPSLEALSVVWEDDDCLVINKAPGILVHRSQATSTSEPSLLEQVRRHARTHVYPVHRLDRGTSGLILFAKHKPAMQQLSMQFQERKVRKRYLAVTRGWMAEKMQLHHPLVRLDANDDKEEEAHTNFEPLGQIEIDHSVDRYPKTRYGLVLAEPHSGRRHQIRRHLKHLHHPIIGDVTYGHGVHNRYFRDDLRCPRLLLHAWTLSFATPTGQALTLTAGWDQDFENIMQIFGWTDLLRRKAGESPECCSP